MKRWLPYFLLLVLLLIFFWQFVFLGRIPIDSTALYQMRPWSTWSGNPHDPSATDTARYFHNIDPVVEVLPVKQWLASRLRSGDVPLWSPSLFSGTPFAANHHAAPWDVSTIFFVLLPVKIAFGIALLFQLFVAAATTFFFCRVLGFAIRSSLLAASGFMLNNFFLHWLGLISFNAGLIWLPLIPAGIELAFQHRIKSGWVLSSLALAFSFLSGMAQFWLFNLFVFITYAIYRFWITKERTSFSKLATVLSLVLGFAGGAVQLTQTLTALPHTSRSGAQTAIYEGRNHLSPRRIPTLLIPDLYGHHPENAFSKLLLNPPDQNAKGIAGRLIWGEKGSVFNRSWGYVGLITFFLMIAGWFKAVRPISYFRWLSIGVIGFQILLCWQPFHRFCAVIWPGFDALDHTRTIILYSFSACILAAYGLETLQQWKLRRKTILLSLYVWLFLLIVTFFAMNMLANSIGYTQKLIHHNEQTDWVTSEFYLDAAPQIDRGIKDSAKILIPPIILTSILLLLLHLWFRNRLSLQLLQTLLLIIVCADLLHRGWTDPPLEFTSAERLYPHGSKIIEFLKKDPDLFRVYELHRKKPLPALPLSRYIDLELYRKGSVRFFDFRSIDFILRPNTLLYYGIDDAGGYLSLYPGRYKELWKGRGMDILKALKAEESIDDAPSLVGMQNIKYVLLPEETSTSSWSPVFQAEGIKVMKVDAFVPRYSAVGKASIIKDPKEISSRSFDPANEVLLETDPQFQTDPQKFQGSVQVLSRTTDTVSLEANFSANGYLVVAENYFPGWRAEVNGKRVEILKANYSFQAIPLPAGKHSIKMEFRPAYYKMSLLISIASFLVMIPVMISAIVRARHAVPLHNGQL